jgi:hypothetical protein
VIGLKVRIDAGFVGTTLDPQVRLLQPGSSIPYATVSLNLPGGAPTPGGRIYLPGQYR